MGAICSKKKERPSDTPVRKEKKPEKEKEKEKECGDLSRFVTFTLEKGVAGIRQEFDDIKAKTVPQKEDCVFFNRQANAAKNRYKDVQCCDNNRIILKEESMGTDYIHANYCGTMTDPKRFICCQGPLKNTINDFWSMVWFEESEFVVMLCNFTEMGKAKCAEYFPQNENEIFLAGNASLKCLSLVKEEWPATISIRKIEIEKIDLGQKRTITHIHWESWPDRGCPPVDNSMYKLLDMTGRSLRPIIVHCSAGIGRTGTAVATHMATEMVEAGLYLDNGISDLVKKMRKQRAGSVQNDQQYLFIYRILLHKFMKDSEKSDPKFEQFCKDYDTATLA